MSCDVEHELSDTWISAVLSFIPSTTVAGIVGNTNSKFTRSVAHNCTELQIMKRNFAAN